MVGTQEPALALLWELCQYEGGRTQVSDVSGEMPTMFETPLWEGTRQEALLLHRSLRGHMRGGLLLGSELLMAPERWALGAPECWALGTG